MRKGKQGWGEGARLPGTKDLQAGRGKEGGWASWEASRYCQKGHPYEHCRGVCRARLIGGGVRLKDAVAPTAGDD